MSFILDALKRSESERQQQASAEFATIPAAAATPGAPRWMWILIALLVGNIAIVGFAMLRTDGPSGSPATAPAPVAGTPVPTASETQAAATETSFAERINTASVPRPEPRSETAPPPPAPGIAEPSASRQGGPQAPVAETSSLALPTLNEVRLNDGVNLPDLHLDIHVYSSAPADRFVFIDMRKHREGSVLEAGPTVEEITPDGVILGYRGTRFVLPRE